MHAGKSTTTNKQSFGSLRKQVECTLKSSSIQVIISNKKKSSQNPSYTF